MGNFSRVGEIWITGFVKMLQPQKGFGFVRGTDGLEYFFHRDDAPDFDALIIGSQVRFVPKEGTKGKGPRASQLELL